MLEVGINILSESWLVLAQMSHWLVFGFLIAGLLSLFASASWLERHLGGGGFGPILKASMFGVPLPLCSCGVIPVAASLKQNGASRGATAAFLLSTPQTGVDSILVTYSMLGPLFAIYRPVAALVSGLIGGALVQAFGEDRVDVPAAEVNRRRADGATEPWSRRLGEALRYGLIQLPKDIAVPLLVGILIAGSMSALIPPQYLTAAIGGGVLSVLLLMAAGVPVYVCATASVPIAAGFIHMGASPGAALAFLVAGPATNAAALATIWKIMGKRTALIYLATVAVSAFLSGVLLNWIAPLITSALPELSTHVHQHDHVAWWQQIAAGLTLAMLIIARWWRFSSPGAGDEQLSISSDQKKLELAVTGMNCGHCQASVKRTISEMEGVDSVVVDLEQGRATVVGRDLESAPMIARITGLGFEAKLAEG